MIQILNVLSQGERDINNLEVKCSNISKGCKWAGPLGDLEDHVARHCGYTEIECPNECSAYIRRRDMDSHKKKCPQRQKSCKYCGDSYLHTLKKDHYLNCRLMPVKCINTGCSVVVARHKMVEHGEMCKYEEVACVYSHIGCTATMKRKDLKAHEEDSKIHFPLALAKIESVESELQQVDTNFRLESMRANLLDEELDTARAKIQQLESQVQKETREQQSIRAVDEVDYSGLPNPLKCTPTMLPKNSNRSTSSSDNNCVIS